MSDTSDAPAVDNALQKFRDMLAKDGYDLSWAPSSVDAGKVVVRIEAGPDACEDCLVPQPVMESIMSQALAETSYGLERVELPAEH
ncbi:hypothetical protein [Georgenia deserti]|uniref:NifU family protein n=1 Tax=Georgenia deserti TaxID=2093781 RepID=A0ABW4L377_9MICO